MQKCSACDIVASGNYDYAVEIYPARKEGRLLLAGGVRERVGVYNSNADRNFKMKQAVR
jgi:hypothetical protein